MNNVLGHYIDSEELITGGGFFLRKMTLSAAAGRSFQIPRRQRNMVVDQEKSLLSKI